MLKFHMLKLLDKDFKSAILIMVQEVCLNTSEKKGKWKGIEAIM